jgi:hypothetical protein
VHLLYQVPSMRAAAMRLAAFLLCRSPSRHISWLVHSRALLLVLAKLLSVAISMTAAYPFF